VKTAGLDSVTLIHAFQELIPGVSNPNREVEMAGGAKILMQSLEIEGVTIVVPTVVASEYLAGIDPDHHEATLTAFRESFDMPCFDLKAASIAAKLWRTHGAIPAAEQLGRLVLKSDVLIIATLKACGVAHYYSNDGRSRRLAEQAGLLPHDLPEQSP